MPQKSTKKEFIDKANKVHNNKYDYDHINYINSITKIDIMCKIHGKFKQTPSMHLQGNGCKKCATSSRRKKLTSNTKHFINKANLIHNYIYNYELVEYIDSKNKINIICNIHGMFKQTPSKHLSGSGCIKCGYLATKNKTKSNKIKFTDKANKIHNNEYNYSKVNYINSQTKVEIICKNHNFLYSFFQTPNSHLNGKGCPKCFGNIKKNNEDFVLEANKIHNDKYLYHKINYINNNSKIEIVCPIHGSFFQSPKNHLNNHGCLKCSGKIVSNNLEFIKKSNKIHNNKYNYSKVNYVSCMKKVEIICNNHGSFFQRPNNHLSGQGCLKCSGSEKLSMNDFLNKAKNNNDNFYQYDYSKAILNGNKTKIEIICKFHGSFWQTPNDHLLNHGCRKCSNTVSKSEINWLDNLNIKEENRQISLPGLPKKWKVDGYDPETNTVYEFLGSYYHGDPMKYNLNDYNKKVSKTFNQLYNKTIKREIKIRKSGYNYQFIWEYDWKNK